MNFGTLYRDELSGFARSKVMIILWIGLPALVILLRLIRPDADEIPLFVFTAVLISAIGGTLSAVMLSTTVTNEKQRHVYDLFLVRPVQRSTLLLAKYFAVLRIIIDNHDSSRSHRLDQGRMRSADFRTMKIA